MSYEPPTIERIVLYDCVASGKRYINTEDMLLEARLLGLGRTSTTKELWDVLTRRGLAFIRTGAIIKGASA